MMDVERPIENKKQSVENSVKTNLCRICLEDGASIPIFESVEEKYKDIQGKLSLCFGDDIPDINGYPRNICETCHNKVIQTVTFISKYKESCKKIKEVFDFVDEDGKDYNVIEPEIQIIPISGRGLTDASTQYEYPCNSEVTRKKRKLKNVKDLISEQEIKKESDYSNKNDQEDQIQAESEGSQLKDCTNKDTEVEIKIEPLNKAPKPRKAREPKPKKIKEPKKEKEPPFSEPTCCEYCGKEYTNRSLLSRHIRIHHDLEKPHQCTTCSKFFSEKKLLKRHVRRVHSGEKNCICSECGRGFVGLSELGSHYKSSHIKKPCPKIYPCKFCGKLYTTSKSAVTHERAVHTGERPAACTICDARFTHDDYLKIHMRLHTGETPFKCPLCCKGFSQSGNMKSHIRHNHSISQTDPEIMKSLNPKYLKYMKP